MNVAFRNFPKIGTFFTKIKLFIFNILFITDDRLYFIINCLAEREESDRLARNKRIEHFESIDQNCLTAERVQKRTTSHICLHESVAREMMRASEKIGDGESVSVCKPLRRELEMLDHSRVSSLPSVRWHLE